MDWMNLWKNVECVDLSVLLSEEYPVSWPTLPHFRKSPLNWFENYTQPSGQLVVSHGYYYDQLLTIDEHSGTHVDFPSHVLPPSELAKLTEVPKDPPLKSFAGPCVMVDATSYLDKANPGASPRIPASVLNEWEETHGTINAHEIVLLNTGYLDRFFRPFPEGSRCLQEPVNLRQVPGWPVPGEDFFEHLATRGVRHLGISSPSMGALDDSFATHSAGVKRGMTFAEFLIGLSNLPPRGAFYVGFPLKIAEQSGSPIRAVAFVPKERKQ